MNTMEIEIHAMTQKCSPPNNTSAAVLEAFASQKRCLMTLWDTLSKVDPEVSNGTLQQVLAVLRHVASTLSFHPAAPALLHERVVLTSVECGCTALQRATEISTQQNDELDERSLLITNCRSCIAEAIEHWPCHYPASILENGWMIVYHCKSGERMLVDG